MMGAAAEFVLWTKNGDHPLDGGLGMTSEGSIVRYFRHPEIKGTEGCSYCGLPMHQHGWIDQGPYGNTVCPGSAVSVVPIEGRFLVKLPPLDPITVSQT